MRNRSVAFVARGLPISEARSPRRVREGTALLQGLNELANFAELLGTGFVKRGRGFCLFCRSSDVDIGFDLSLRVGEGRRAKGSSRLCCDR